ESGRVGEGHKEKAILIVFLLSPTAAPLRSPFLSQFISPSARSFFHAFSSVSLAFLTFSSCLCVVLVTLRRAAPLPFSLPVHQSFSPLLFSCLLLCLHRFSYILIVCVCVC